jgi:hypothetical protein
VATSRFASIPSITTDKESVAQAPCFDLAALLPWHDRL